MSVAEQRYQAVLAVIGDGRTVTDVAGQWGVSRQTIHAWLGKYEAGGLEGLADSSRRPRSCPHQMSAAAEAAALELRRVHPYWGARRIAWELGQTPAGAGGGGAVGVGGVSVSGADRGDRRGGPAAARPEVEAVGAR